MKKLVLGICLLLGSNMLFAQTDNDYKDLLELLVDEKYERVLYKAEKYTLEDKTKKDPLPYLYMSMAFFEINQHPEYEEKYAAKYDKPFKESLKYAVKHRKKDKENKYYDEYAEFFSELRQLTIEEADLYNMQEKYTKSKGLYKYLTSLDENDAGAWMMKGYTEMMLKSKKDSELSYEEAYRILSEQLCSGMADEQRDLLKSALIMYGEALDGQGERSKAKEWLDLGIPYFEEDKEYQISYDMIVNG